MILIHALRSLIFYIGYVFSMVIFSSTAMLISPFSRRTSMRICANWCQVAVVWAHICCGIRYEITGAENIPAGGCVVLAKHQSAWETLIVQSLFYPAATVIKRELLSIPFFGWSIRLCDPIAIDRDDASGSLKAVVRGGTQKIAEGRRVVIFPEGTRTMPGEENPDYSVGGAMLATQAKALVLPVAINSGDCWPRGTLIKKPGLVRVIIGKPIDATGYKAKVLNAEVRDWIEAQMREISPAYQKKPQA